MNVETSQSTFPTTTTDTSSGTGLNGGPQGVHRVAQKVHEAVDTLEHKIGAGSEKVMSLQQEYGEMAREQVRANPLVAVGAAFAVGYVFAKLFSSR
jgi:ElaB/YqjD/DUF883 family membrane-anchored ribosome-binding protein